MELFGGQPGTPFRSHAASQFSRLFAPGPLSVAATLAGIAFLTIFLASPVYAQRGGHPTPPSNPPSGGIPSQPGGTPYGGSPYGGAAYGSSPSTDPNLYGPMATDPFLMLEGPMQMGPVMMPIDTSRIFHAESCEDWTQAAVDSPTVSVGRLAVPGKASGEFQKACRSYKQQRFAGAENHARKAIKIYPDYAAAWVLLGQVLIAEHKDDEGRAACNQAKAVDPKYAPPYVCLADFASRAKDWKQEAALSDFALSLDPVTNMYAYMYAADADLHLHNIDKAQTNAEAAEKLDRWRKAPEIHLLLAQIYQVKGDRPKEISELRQYLKVDPHAPDSALAKATLTQVEDPAR
ncbi:MAG TPA: tetratricopeptide repeat protein [Candidatus Dormibacteraeota bacterium]|nr:tetratricopeptide repeat protein [Candidatus Dormibacteraeota bacterium]